MSLWNDQGLLEMFLNSTPLIDVRAPIEFKAGSIPGSVNLPIMNDDERAKVGTLYKQVGQTAAIHLGHELVSGRIKEAKIENWQTFIKKNPATRVFCFRGGLRSQIACQWLREAGIDSWPIEGGYKRLRHFFLSWLDEAPLQKFYRIGGLTGTGKTPFLKTLPLHIDIEGLARHRGSAFGTYAEQPAQVTFENDLALELLKLKESAYLIVEDESATIGKVGLPQRFFAHHRNSPIVLLKASEEERIANIYRDYVKDSTAQFFLENLVKIKKRISLTDYNEIALDIQRAFSEGKSMEDHQHWISMLLRLYYDPMYEKDLKRNAHLIVFQGEEKDVRDFFHSSLR